MRIAWVMGATAFLGIVLYGCAPDQASQSSAKGAGAPLPKAAAKPSSVHLSPGQKCEDGIVVLHYRGAGGEEKTRQWILGGGKVMKCSGDYLVLDEPTQG